MLECDSLEHSSLSRQSKHNVHESVAIYDEPVPIPVFDLPDFPMIRIPLKEKHAI